MIFQTVIELLWIIIIHFVDFIASDFNSTPDLFGFRNKPPGFNLIAHFIQQVLALLIRLNHVYFIAACDPDPERSPAIFDFSDNSINCDYFFAIFIFYLHDQLCSHIFQFAHASVRMSSKKCAKYLIV